MWLLWGNRNDVLHGSNSKSTSLLWNRAVALHGEITSSCPRTEASWNLNQLGSSVWRIPPSSFIKINVDVSFLDMNVIAGGGLVCRNYQGRLIKAVGFTLEAESVLAAELFCCLKALQLAWDEGWERIWIETDSLEAFHSLNFSSSPDLSSQINFLIFDILEHRNCFERVIFDHVLRDANSAADWVSKLARARGPFVVFPSDIPVLLGDILRNDCTS